MNMHMCLCGAIVACLLVGMSSWDACFCKKSSKSPSYWKPRAVRIKLVV